MSQFKVGVSVQDSFLHIVFWGLRFLLPCRHTKAKRSTSSGRRGEVLENVNVTWTWTWRLQPGLFPTHPFPTPCLVSDIISGFGNWPEWEYLHHSIRQMLPFVYGEVFYWCNVNYGDTGTMVPDGRGTWNLEGSRPSLLGIIITLLQGWGNGGADILPHFPLPPPGLQNQWTISQEGFLTLALTALPSGLANPEHLLAGLLAILFLMYTRVCPPLKLFQSDRGKENAFFFCN